jgi:RNA polymerase sigma factor (sigma-70 family)
MPAKEPQSSAADPVDQAVANEQQARMLAAINKLPERQREVTLLSLGEGLSAQETAQVLDISEANVHTCLNLARKRIATAIGFDYARREST